MFLKMGESNESVDFIDVVLSHLFLYHFVIFTKDYL